MDYHKNPTEYRIKVLGFKNLGKLENVYHTRPKSLRLLLNYFPVMGMEGLFYKVWSRLREDYRNEKYISCGFGEIIETADNQIFSSGDMVEFLAPWHPALVERIVLPEILLSKVNKEDLPNTPSQKILYSPITIKETATHAWWKNFQAWSIYSGKKISNDLKPQISEGINLEIKNNDWDHSQHLSIEELSPVSKARSMAKRSSKKLAFFLVSETTQKQISFLIQKGLLTFKLSTKLILRKFSLQQKRRAEYFSISLSR